MVIFMYNLVVTLYFYGVATRICPMTGVMGQNDISMEKAR